MKIIWAIIVISFFGFGPVFSYDEAYLRCIDVYPKEWHNVYFKTIPNFAVDEIGNIYAVDNRIQVFYKFDVILDEVKAFSHPGEGPGELQHPTNICLSANKIFIKDDVGINIFQVDGNFISRFRIYTPIISFAADNQYVYVATTGGEKLIDIYTFQGKRLASFGEKYPVPPGIYRGWADAFIERVLNTGKIIIGKEYIYFVSYLFSDLYQYDHRGALLRKMTIEADDQIVKESIKYYFRQGQKRTPGKGGFRFYKNTYLVWGACSFDGRLFFLQEESIESSARRMKILEVREKDMIQLKIYLFNIGPKDAIEDFCVGGSDRISPDFYFSLYDDKQQEFLIKKYKEVLK